MGLKQKDGKWWYTKAGKVFPEPSCYGRLYEGGLQDEGGDQCRRCAFREPCLLKLIDVTIPALEAEGKTTDVDLAAELAIQVESVIYAQHIRKERLAQTVPPTPAESVAGAGGSAATAQRTRKAKPKRKGTAKSAEPQEGPPRRSSKWSPYMDHGRWERERERSPEIGALTPGMRLRRTFKGEDYQVVVVSSGYVYDGEYYPTLYSVTKEITGTHEAPRQLAKDGTRPKGTRSLSNWSATKFWRLGRYAPQPKKRRQRK